MPPWIYITPFFLKCKNKLRLQHNLFYTPGFDFKILIVQNIQWKQYISIVYKELPALSRQKPPESYPILSHSPLPQLPPTPKSVICTAQHQQDKKTVMGQSQNTAHLANQCSLTKMQCFPFHMAKQCCMPRSVRNRLKA